VIILTGSPCVYGFLKKPLSKECYGLRAQLTTSLYLLRMCEIPHQYQEMNYFIRESHEFYRSEYRMIPMQAGHPRMK
jgi:hypothetical protein